MLSIQTRSTGFCCLCPSEFRVTLGSAEDFRPWQGVEKDAGQAVVVKKNQNGEKDVNDSADDFLHAADATADGLGSELEANQDPEWIRLSFLRVKTCGVFSGLEDIKLERY